MKEAEPGVEDKASRKLLSVVIDVSVGSGLMSGPPCRGSHGMA